MTDRSFECSEFRKALGEFATGVTVVTTKVQDGSYAGVTVSSFSSLSLDPPLVLWSLARESKNMPAFATAKHFAVNVLAEDQVSLSRRFAITGKERFEDVPFEAGLGGAPLLAGCVAWFQCATRHRHEGGDHLIVVGEVVEFERVERPALLYHRGMYSVSRPHPDEDV
jgi:3-hydroxy-9,10-secoandrosta-1,3,5(10)-triene-9,17-dione monooxygenase reductase component